MSTSPSFDKPNDFSKKEAEKSRSVLPFYHNTATSA